MGEYSVRFRCRPVASRRPATVSSGIGAALEVRANRLSSIQAGVAALSVGRLPRTALHPCPARGPQLDQGLASIGLAHVPSVRLRSTIRALPSDQSLGMTQKEFQALFPYSVANGHCRIAASPKIGPAPPVGQRFLDQVTASRLRGENTSAAPASLQRAGSSPFLADTAGGDGKKPPRPHRT